MLDAVLKYLPRKIQREVNTYRLGRVLVKSKESYLVTTGYVRSRVEKKIEDNNGDFVPWMTYPIIGFLNERINKEQDVLEYGSGASTIFFAKRAKSVVSIEYSEKWYFKIEGLLEDQGLHNVRLHYAPVGPGYTGVQKFAEGNKKFHVVVIDGRERVESAINSFEVLSPEGVLILDDSERERYGDIYDFYLSRGFSELTFEGIKPGGFRKSKTTIFYRRGHNCFKI